ncbi:hypothetical protein ACS0TY_016635 [Phlomoides rotata]
MTSSAPPGNDRNTPQSPSPASPNGNAVYLHQLYREPEPERWFRVSRELPYLCHTLAWGSVALLGISCLLVLLWVLFHPIFPKLDVAAANLSISAVNATSATAECNATFVLTNPNRHITTLFDRMEISLFYPSQQVVLSHASQPPIVQPKKSRTTFETNLSFNGVNLGTDVAKAMKKDVDGGSISLGVRIVARVRYRRGKWKSRAQYMRAYCIGVSFAFPSLNYKKGLFLNPYHECEVNLYAK